MRLKVLGMGCAKCQQLEANVREAAHSLGMAAEVEKVTRLPDIMKYDVLSMPALVVDERVRVAGRVPDVAELAVLLGGKG